MIENWTIQKNGKHLNMMNIDMHFGLLAEAEKHHIL
jgi:hypothetical protein